jgi:hypothetical protein
MQDNTEIYTEVPIETEDINIEQDNGEQLKMVSKKRRKQLNMEKKIQTINTLFMNGVNNINDPKLKKMFKVPMKNLEKLVEDFSKESNKKIVKTKLTGFDIPNPVTDETCEFLNMPIGSKITWGQLTVVVSEYIKENSLQNQNAKLYINPDYKLASIIKYDPEIDGLLTYRNLQRKLRNCFPHLPQK